MQRVEAAGGDAASYFPAVEQAVGAYELASQQVQRLTSPRQEASSLQSSASAVLCWASTRS